MSNGQTPSDHESIEEKKWLVNRVETTINQTIAEINNEREHFESLVQRIEINLKGWRNAILAAVTFAAVIILGIYSGFSIEMLDYRQLAIVLISADILIGIVVFIVMSFLEEKAYFIIESGNRSFLNALDNMYEVTGVFIGITESLQEVSIKKLEFYFHYMPLANTASRFGVFKAINKMLGSYLFGKIKSELQNDKARYDEQIDIICDYYKHFEKEFNSEKDFKHLSKIHNAFLEYCKNKPTKTYFK